MTASEAPPSEDVREPKARLGPVPIPAARRERVALVLALCLVAGVTVAVKVVAGSHRAPTFSRGGTFASQAPAELQPEASPEGASPSPTATAPRPTGAPIAIRPPLTPRPQPGVDDAASVPAVGTYVYAVQGTEEATGFGSRSFPPEMTMVAKHDAGADRRFVFDLTYSSEHEERQIVSYAADGVALTFEAGSVTFGVTQTSEANYDPPMLQVPLPLSEGERRSGTTTARAPGSAEVSRVVDWTVSVGARETIDVLGAPTHVWVVKIERTSRPGTPEQEKRSRTYWYDPSRSLWVKWHETLEASKAFGPGRFTYRDQYTATLKSAP